MRFHHRIKAYILTSITYMYTRDVQHFRFDSGVGAAHAHLLWPGNEAHWVQYGPVLAQHYDCGVGWGQSAAWSFWLAYEVFVGGIFLNTVSLQLVTIVRWALRSIWSEKLASICSTITCPPWWSWPSLGCPSGFRRTHLLQGLCWVITFKYY